MFINALFRIRNAPKTIKEIELVRRIVYDAVSIWRVSNLEFFEANEQDADIEISFQSDADNFGDQIIGFTVHDGNKSLIYFNDRLNWTFYSGKQGS